MAGAGATPIRTWGLAALGVAIGLACHFILPPDTPRPVPPGTLQQTLVTFLGVAGLAFAFVVSAARWRLAIGFAIAAGAIVAFAVNQGGSGGFDNQSSWRLVAALLAVAISAPLLLAWSEPPGALRWRRPDYAGAHDQAWTCLVLLAGGLLFLGLVWAMAWLLAGLFNLIGIDIVEQLLRRRPVQLMLTGGALGVGIGLLRARAALLGTLRSVVTTVLGVLAPVFAIGLTLFLLALPLTGLAPLWGATKATTPILLVTILGALTLANAVVGEADAEMPRARLLRLAAPLLLVALLPLAVIAAVSVGLRLQQYGLTPDRLWALTFVVIATGYGVAAWAALALGRRAGWTTRLRRANLDLAFGLCAIAALLSTPLIDFNVLSVRSQLARLEQGIVKPDAFDFAALRFDLGEPGRAALRRIAIAGVAAWRVPALAALNADNRYLLSAREDARRLVAAGNFPIGTVPSGHALPLALREALLRDTRCFQQTACVLVFAADGSAVAIAIGAQDWNSDSTRLVQDKAGGWRAAAVGVDSTAILPGKAKDQAEAALRTAVRAGRIELRPAPIRQQLYIDGKPVGPELEVTPSR